MRDRIINAVQNIFIALAMLALAGFLTDGKDAGAATDTNPPVVPVTETYCPDAGMCFNVDAKVDTTQIDDRR